MRSVFQWLFALVLVVSLSSSATAQYYYYNNSHYDRDLIFELGISGGAMFGQTDVGKKGIMPDLKSSQGNISLYAGAMYQNTFGLRVELTYGRIAGADSAGGSRPARNLSFRTPIQELAVIGEFHPLMLKQFDELPRYSPYIAVGLGFFSFNPQANLNGRWVDLRPLRTEGQGFAEMKAVNPDSRPYNLQQSNVILGAGLKYELSQLLTVRAEMLFRITHSDYLDDISTIYIDPAWFTTNLTSAQAALATQLYDRAATKHAIGSDRGEPKKNDAFWSFNLKVGINLGRSRQ